MKKTLSIVALSLSVIIAIALSLSVIIAIALSLSVIIAIALFVVWYLGIMLPLAASTFDANGFELLIAIIGISADDFMFIMIGLMFTAVLSAVIALALTASYIKDDEMAALNAKVKALTRKAACR